MSKFFRNIFSIIIAAAPALAVYKFLPGTNLAMALWIAFGLLCYITDSKKNITSKDEFQLFMAVLLLTAVASFYMTMSGTRWFDGTLMFHNLWSIIACFLPLIYVIRKLNVSIFVNTVYVLGTLAALIVIWQRLSFLMTGNFYKEVFLPGFELARGIDDMSFNRPSAFFSEPAHFCTFVLPILYLSLIGKRYYLLAFFAFSILCSGSTTGFVMLPILLLYYLYGLEGPKRYFKIATCFFLILAGYMMILQYYPEIILENIDKIEVMQSGDDDSYNERMGSLGYIKYLNGIQLIVGITLNQLNGLLTSEGFFFEERSGNYTSGIVYMFISYGAIGLLMLLRYLYKKWKSTPVAKGFLLIFIGILCSDQILFNSHFLYLAVFTIHANNIYKLVSNYEKNNARIRNET